MPVAVMSSEDQNFLKHHGFDYGAIERAAKENVRGRRIRGGSTISQQTAKNVFLWPGRSWVRKGFEAYFTFLIELFWSKQRIMEVYLNSIEMGDGIYGVEAVAEQHFNCTASELTGRLCPDSRDTAKSAPFQLEEPWPLHAQTATLDTASDDIHAGISTINLRLYSRSKAVSNG